MWHKVSGAVGNFSTRKTVVGLVIVFSVFAYFTALGSVLPNRDLHQWARLFVAPKAHLPSIPHTIAFDIAIDPTDSANLYLAVDTPVPILYSKDFGATWLTQTVGLPTTAIGHRIAIDPTRPERIFLGLANGSIYRSDNGGSTWIESLGSTGTSLGALTVHPITPTVVFAGSAVGLPYIYRSEDGGNSWTSIALTEPSNREVTQIVVDRKDPAKVYAVVKDEGVFVSLNVGLTWENSGTLADWIAIDPVNPDTMYKIQCELYKSENGGAWVQMATPNPCYERLYITPNSSNILYLTTQYRSATKSTDGGASWELLDRSIAGSLYEQSVPFAVDPRADDRAYLYTASTTHDLEWDLFVLPGYPTFISFLEK